MQETNIGVGKMKPTASQKRRTKEQPKKIWLAVSRGAWQMGQPASVADMMFFRSSAALDWTWALVSNQAKNCSLPNDSLGSAAAAVTLKDARLPRPTMTFHKSQPTEDHKLQAAHRRHGHDRRRLRNQQRLQLLQ
jgi:hypothetical protein